MDQAKKPSGDPEFLTNGGLAVFIVAGLLTFGIDWSILYLGSQKPPLLIDHSYFAIPITPAVAAIMMFTVAATLWASGFLRPRWRVWIGSAAPSPALWAEWPLWRQAKILAIAMAIISLPPMLFFLGLGGGPVVAAFFGFFYFVPMFLPTLVTALAGVVLADWLMFAGRSPPKAFLPKRARGQLHAALYCAVYLFIVFDVMILLPRSTVMLFGPEKTLADQLVVSSAAILIVWSIAIWFMGRQRRD